MSRKVGFDMNSINRCASGVIRDRDTILYTAVKCRTMGVVDCLYSREVLEEMVEDGLLVQSSTFTTWDGVVTKYLVTHKGIVRFSEGK